MVKRDTITGDYIGLACDTCGEMAPSSKEIMAAHGLINLGWYCSGGVHICPKHEQPHQESLYER